METPDTPSEVTPQAGAGPGAAAGALAAKPTGPAAAVMLAAGFGALVLGLLTVLSEASEGVHDFLEWSERVGPLSGKTSLAAIAFVVSWGGLHLGLRDRDIEWRTVVIATVVLVAIGLVLTFPPFFELFKSD
ncbi:MAG TPA: hypothetical protein VFZ41_03885 [Solirubrobacterales bacterium]